MGLFKHKERYALSDILKGLHHAVNSAQEMLQAQQVQSLLRFWQSDDGIPVTIFIRKLRRWRTTRNMSRIGSYG